MLSCLPPNSSRLSLLWGKGLLSSCLRGPGWASGSEQPSRQHLLNERLKEGHKCPQPSALLVTEPSLKSARISWQRSSLAPGFAKATMASQSVTMKWYGRRFEKTSAGGGTFFFFKAVMEESRPAVLPKGCGLVWPTKFSRAPGFL